MMTILQSIVQIFVFSKPALEMSPAVFLSYTQCKQEHRLASSTPLPVKIKEKISILQKKNETLTLGEKDIENGQ
ncbi:hypothetical protein Hanom_Chr10g00914741 [Helianthus anomalus]